MRLLLTLRVGRGAANGSLTGCDVAKDADAVAAAAAAAAADVRTDRGRRDCDDGDEVAGDVAVEPSDALDVAVGDDVDD